ncbi:MAG: TerC family protein, partial [Actinomycetospora chiangmaiensis]|nr:TerC family protein [Actinomycetospora chiangmaiensis]
IGAKIVVADTFGLLTVPPWVSLVVTLLLLFGGVAYSLWRTRVEAKAQPDVALPKGEARAHRA